ncbi:2-methylpropanoate--CoA ligase ccl4 [Stylosanthes scabra]|uniref:2-methylpropanoate--CoA ligase ccl4 n=1 Tax=Stylosanthes scabra TaxID=79078 RepID=A0ABU6TF26_9FABA|nr:2-methylpropanoate--CoA ligase ccl4 [Stylosanthes scabra]
MEELKASAANSSPLTPIGFLDRAATVYADTPSVIYNAVTSTWSHTRRRCLQLASALSSLKISRGDVVSVLAPNIPATYELHFAIPFAGAIINILNTRVNARTLSAVLRHAESKLLFVDIASRDVVLEALSLFPENNPHRPILILIEDDEVEPLTPSSTVDFEDTYEGLISKGDPNFKWLYPNSEWDPLRLNYTSGTTSSSPQGVVHSHRGTYVMTVDSLMDWAVQKQPVFLWTVKMFHANGWCFPWGIAAVGGTNICVRNFDAPSVFSLITRHRVTHMCASPVLLSMLANENKPLENPVHILTAGAPPPPAVIQRTESLGFIVSHGYGLTETGGVVVSCAWKGKWNHFPAEERARLKARQGVRTLLTAEVEVVTSAGESVKHDGVTLGEIVIRGSCVMLGYLKDPERTRNRLKNGYFYTGDVGVIHEDGYLEIKDRLSDIITSGGKIISSVEVESLLYMHPAVNEVAVVARPDEYCGQTPCAFVSLKEGMVVTEEEIIEHCKKKMATYMVPKTVAFREELPKSSTGKIKKTVLRQTAKEMGSITYQNLNNCSIES